MVRGPSDYGGQAYHYGAAIAGKPVRGSCQAAPCKECAGSAQDSPCEVPARRNCSLRGRRRMRGAPRRFAVASAVGKCVSISRAVCNRPGKVPSDSVRSPNGIDCALIGDCPALGARTNASGAFVQMWDPHDPASATRSRRRGSDQGTGPAPVSLSRPARPSHSSEPPLTSFRPGHALSSYSGSGSASPSQTDPSGSLSAAGSTKRSRFICVRRKSAVTPTPSSRTARAFTARSASRRRPAAA